MQEELVSLAFASVAYSRPAWQIRKGLSAIGATPALVVNDCRYYRVADVDNAVRWCLDHHVYKRSAAGSGEE